VRTSRNLGQQLQALGAVIRTSVGFPDDLGVDSQPVVQAESAQRAHHTFGRAPLDG
jgi:hypothetical protein